MDFWMGLLEMVIGFSLLAWLLWGGVERLFAPARSLVRDGFRYRKLKLKETENNEC